MLQCGSISDFSITCQIALHFQITKLFSGNVKSLFDFVFVNEQMPFQVVRFKCPTTVAIWHEADCE